MFFEELRGLPWTLKIPSFFHWEEKLASEQLSLEVGLVRFNLVLNIFFLLTMKQNG